MSQRNDAGWLAEAEHIASPNHDARPTGVNVDLIVIHAISLPPDRFEGNAVTDFFTNRLDPLAHPYFATIADRSVSAHFFIRRSGHLIQFVACHARAWHAGVSCWQGRERCNDFSIGIELEGSDTQPFAEPQYQRLASLLATLSAHYPAAAIVGHCDIAPGRKTDPGPHFDWTRIARRKR